MKRYDPTHLDVAIVTAVFVFLALAFAHWIMGCSSGYSCDTNADCPIGAFCDPTQPNGPICVPVDVRDSDSGTDASDPLVAYPTRWMLPSNPLCPICVSPFFPVGCVIGKSITCVGEVADCSGDVCPATASDAGSVGSDAGSDSGTDSGTASTDAGPPPPTPCGSPGCTYDWCGTGYSNNCPTTWNGNGDGCDCGCQFYDTDCGG